MPYREIELNDDPAIALETIHEASRNAPVLILKTSPVCSISRYVEGEYEKWRESLPTDFEVAVAVIDVIARKTLARGLTERLEIRHESPQALLFVAGSLKWHDSHHHLTAEHLLEVVPGTLDADGTHSGGHD